MPGFPGGPWGDTEEQGGSEVPITGRPEAATTQPQVPLCGRASSHTCTSLPTGPSGPCSPCGTKVGQCEAVLPCRRPCTGAQGSVPLPCLLHSPVALGGRGVPAVLASRAGLAPPRSRARPSAPAGRQEEGAGNIRRDGVPKAAPMLPAEPHIPQAPLTTPARPVGPGCPGVPGGPCGQREECQLRGTMATSPLHVPKGDPTMLPSMGTILVCQREQDQLTMSPGGPCRPWGPMGPGSP